MMQHKMVVLAALITTHITILTTDTIVIITMEAMAMDTLMGEEIGFGAQIKMS